MYNSNRKHTSKFLTRVNSNFDSQLTRFWKNAKDSDSDSLKNWLFKMTRDSDSDSILEIFWTRDSDSDSILKFLLTRFLTRLNFESKKKDSDSLFDSLCESKNWLVDTRAKKIKKINENMTIFSKKQPFDSSQLGFWLGFDSILVKLERLGLGLAIKLSFQNDSGLGLEPDFGKIFDSGLGLGLDFGKFVDSDSDSTQNRVKTKDSGLALTRYLTFQKRLGLFEKTRYRVKRLTRMFPVLVFVARNFIEEMKKCNLYIYI